MVNRKILIHSIVFSPDGVSTAYLYNDIALAFRQSGYDVVVLTTTPHYNVVASELKKQPMSKKWLGLFSVSYFNGIKVYHIPQKKFKSTLLRMIGFLYWHLLSLIIGLSIKGVNAILSPSPPLTIGLINIIIGKFKKAKVVYNVQEIYPDFLIEQGGLKSELVIKFLKFVERFIYNKSDAVTTIDQVFYNTIVSRFKNKSKLQIIPNFVDSELYRPLSDEQINLDPTIFLRNDSLKLMYAGNIGHAQDWLPLIESAKALKNQNVEFYVIGEGVMKQYLLEKKAQFNLDKVHILPYQKRELMPHLLAFSDIQFIFMSKELEGHGFPSKVYTIMSCRKPLIVCSGENTPITNFLLPLGCAKVFLDESLDSKVDQIVSFINTVSKNELIEMGYKGYSVINESYTKRQVTSQYVQLFNTLLF